MNLCGIQHASHNKQKKGGVPLENPGKTLKKTIENSRKKLRNHRKPQKNHRKTIENPRKTLNNYRKHEKNHGKTLEKPRETIGRWELKTPRNSVISWDLELLLGGRAKLETTQLQ